MISTRTYHDEDEGEKKSFFLTRFEIDLFIITATMARKNVSLGSFSFC
jgi:hypothetical protein